MSVDLKIEGLDELLKRVEEMGNKGSNIQGKALKKAGEYLKEQIKTETPVKTGGLRDSIEVSTVKTKQGRRYIEVGPNAKTNWRAKFVEYGTSKMRANPFMSRTFERNKDEIQNMIKEEIKKGLGLE